VSCDIESDTYRLLICTIVKNSLNMLGAYELKRLSKIRRNQAVLASLGLAKPILQNRTPAPKSSRPKQHRPPAKPTRKSRRIAAIPAPSVYVESELANGTLRLGGDDAQTCVTDSKRKWDCLVSRVASDDDLAPDDENLLFPDEAKVYALLREEKNAMARELDAAAYHVAQNRALMSMARLLPTTPMELLNCWGWGEAKVSAHGDRLLAVLAPFVESLQNTRVNRKSGTSKSRASSSPFPAPVVTPTKGDIVENGDCENRYDEDNFGPLPIEPSDLKQFELPAFDAILAWKRARAKELGYNDPCVICHNRTLCELVRILPSSLAALGSVWGIGGIGTKRNDQHGLLMLDALRPFRADLLAARPKPSISGGVHDEISKAQPRNRKRPRTNASSTWEEEAGENLASEAWRARRTVHRLPACDWAGRRERCERVNGCVACGRYVAAGRKFAYAPMTQRVLDILSSPGAYGSHAAAHAAGWRWNARPNHGQSSHAHEWWPPEAAVPQAAKMPLGTYAALDVIEEMF